MTASSIDDVLAELDEVIDRAIADRDAAGYFAVLYRKVTAKVQEGIAAGFFDDAERMEHLDVLFARRYLDAVTAQRSGASVTASWQLAFDAGSRWRPVVLQHLLVGINAHINLDLGIAAARCSPGRQLATLRRDYDRVNAALARMVAGAQRDLARVSPWMGLLDRVGGRTPDELVRFSIVAARTGAWQFATELAAMPESEWETAITRRDGRVARVGERVLHPGTLMNTALMLVRLREDSDVAANLQLLLGAPEPSLADVETATDAPSLAP